MTVRLCAALLLLGVVAATGCRRTAGPPREAEPPPAPRESLLAADRAAADACAQGLAAGLAAVLADDVIFLAPGEAVLLGAPAVKAWLASRPDAGLETLSWESAGAVASAAGDLGATFGWRARAGAPGADGAVTEIHGKFVAVWARAGETWRLRAYTFAESPVEPAAPPPGERPRDLPGTAPPMVVMGARARELLDADSAFAALAQARGTGEAFATFAADRAVLLGAGEPLVVGREAIRAARRSEPGAPVLTWAPRFAEVAASGDLGLTIGYFAVPTTPEVLRGKYLTVWQRQADGSWRYVLDSGSSMKAAPPESGL
jgi:ketosteroid isomerase-like protein